VGRGLKDNETDEIRQHIESPHASGAWIEGLSGCDNNLGNDGRPTRVGRGLKVTKHCNIMASGTSPHASGAWIEGYNGRGLAAPAFRSPHASGAWIEGFRSSNRVSRVCVAPREWGVD
jgi:hypothetical protein